jgi:hypothetical protein
MFAAVAFAAAGAACRDWRPEFRMHLYVVSLVVAMISLPIATDAGTLATILTIYIGLYAAIAAFEHEPIIAGPAMLFGFAAVAAWRAAADADFATIPVAYAVIGTALYAAGVAMASVHDRGAVALRACGGVYAAVAPIAGFGILAWQSENGFVGTTHFELTALYQWSTLCVALGGVLLLAEALVADRKRMIVPASAVLLVATLLQVGRFSPDNPQAYTLIVGAYLLGLGLLGLWKFRLVPEFEDAAPLVEALGAAVIMLPTFLQSLDGGYQYQLILLAEATVFLCAGVALRRRGILGASLVALVLVAARAMLDAVHVLPNWVVVMIAGVALLGIGMSILAGRERWSRWQEALLGWWDEGGDGAVA